MALHRDGGDTSTGLKHPDGPDIGRMVFQMETDFDKFKEARNIFIKSLAEVLEDDDKNLRIVSIRRGCVLATIEMPADSQALLMQELEIGPRSKTLRDFMEQYNVVEIYDPESKRPPHIKRSTDSPGRRLTWLHISDLHMRDDEGAASFDQSHVTASLSERLPRLLQESDVHPNFVFFTGDVAFSGSPEQYALARQFFQDLSSNLDPAPPVYFIPGNHDVHWPKVDRDLDVNLRESLVDDDSVMSLLRDPSKSGQRAMAFERLDHYNQFAIDAQPESASPPPPNYFYWSTHPHEGVKVGIAGLNSAWRSTNKQFSPRSKFSVDPDLHHLILGEEQLATVSERLEHTDIRFALVHHPPMTDWFSDFDADMQTDYWPRFDFVLRGHLHRYAHFGMNDFENGSVWHHFGAGALSTGKKKHRKGMTAVKLDMDRGIGEVYYWAYLKASTGWEIDVKKTLSGAKAFAVPDDLRSRLLARTPQ